MKLEDKNELRYCNKEAELLEDLEIFDRFIGIYHSVLEDNLNKMRKKY